MCSLVIHCFVQFSCVFAGTRAISIVDGQTEHLSGGFEKDDGGNSSCTACAGLVMDVHAAKAWIA